MKLGISLHSLIGYAGGIALVYTGQAIVENDITNLTKITIHLMIAFTLSLFLGTMNNDN